MGADEEKKEKPIHFEEKLVTGKEDDLNVLKAWLFQENIRLETRNRELDHLEEKLRADKQQFRKEMDEVNRRLVIERKRLKQDELFFDKKLDILKNGFRELEEERRKMERERIALQAEKSAHEQAHAMETGRYMADMLFKGVKSQLALKKRYRDLLKLFHPDNIAGDHEMVLLINSAYERLKKEYESDKWA